MKNIISDPIQIKGIKEKLSGWLGSHLKGLDTAPIDIIEISEYPLRRLVVKAEVQTRTLKQFKRPGAKTAPAAAQPVPPAGEIDVRSIEIGAANDLVDGKNIVEIPYSTVSMPCAKCGGTGKFTCPECQGQKSVYCQSCHGDGKIVCPKCRKTLKINCQACEGRGKVYSNAQQAYVECTVCDGKGSAPCKDCKNGYNQCGECGGKGRIPCPNCAEAGSKDCLECSGKGNFVSGSGIEIISKQLEEKTIIPNADIPETIINGEFPAVSYETEKVFTGGQGTPAVPVEIKGQADILLNQVEVPPGGRVIKTAFAVEKKSYFNMKYKSGAVEGSAWFLITGEKVQIESKFLKEIYSRLMSGLETLNRGETAAVQQAIKKIENIPALKSEAENFQKRLAKGILPSYIKGGAGGLYYIFVSAYGIRAPRVAGEPQPKDSCGVVAGIDVSVFIGNRAIT